MSAQRDHSRTRSGPCARRACTGRAPSLVCAVASGCVWRFSHHAGSAAPHPFIAIVTRLSPSSKYPTRTCRGRPLRRPVVVSHSAPQRPGFGRQRPTSTTVRHADERAVCVPEEHHEPARWQRRPVRTGARRTLVRRRAHDDTSRARVVRSSVSVMAVLSGPCPSGAGTSLGRRPPPRGRSGARPSAAPATDDRQSRWARARVPCAPSGRGAATSER